jgi:GTPase SAR1 family protein
MLPMYYRGSNAAILVFDITIAESFESVKHWVRGNLDI